MLVKGGTCERERERGNNTGFSFLFSTYRKQHLLKREKREINVIPLSLSHVPPPPGIWHARSILSIYTMVSGFTPRDRHVIGCRPRTARTFEPFRILADSLLSRLDPD